MTTGGSGGSGPMAGSGGSGVLAGSGGAVAGSGSGVSGAGGAVAGSGGSGVSASGGGGAGPVAGAGAGGMMTDPQAEIDDAVKNLKGFRYENRCGYVDGHPLSTCTTGEVCWPNSTKARFTEKRDIAIGGRAGTVYDVTLRIRGVIEPRDYPTNCTRLPGGASNTIGVITNCDGFANRASVTFNVYEFKIPRPAAVYYFNAVPVHPPHRVDRIDQQFAIKVEGQSAITFTFDDLNGGEIRNCSLTVEGIAPYPQVFDGNYFQLDVVDARIAP
jgi:hypothetical protein